MTFEGYIYKRDPKKNKFTTQEQAFWYGVLILFISVIILWFNDNYWELTWVSYVFKRIAILALIISALGKWAGINTKDPLNGSLNGYIRISEESIEINKTVYRIVEIKNLRLVLHDYSGELRVRPNNPGPRRANGTGNKISFLYNKEQKEEAFYIPTEFEYKKLEKIKAGIDNLSANCK